MRTDCVPLLTDSAPKDGPTTLSSIISTGAGSAPALNTIAISLASSLFANPKPSEPRTELAWIIQFFPIFVSE